ncbi:MAG: glycosyl hydrolase [Anaerolineae bacterium]
MSNTLVLGTRKGVLILEQKGKDWQLVCEAHRGVPASYAATDARTGTLWAGLDHGHWGQKLHRSRDMGATWEEIPAPKYPEGETIRDDKPATLSYIWLVAPGGKDQPNRMYLGTEPGGLFQSDDGGATYQLVRGLWDHPSRKDNWFGGGRDHPGLCSLVIDPRDSQHMWAGISVGGVYETHDGGITWEGRNQGLKADYLPNPYAEYGHDPHFMMASPADPDVLWQQNHCGIFRSVDGGQHWDNISQPGGPAYFGFAIALDEHDPETAWVVPAVDAEFRLAVDRALCVCRTNDGGKTWTALRNGLPQQDTYDLVFRHALDISGDTLVFGTTTGNLYLSEDRGETWRCLGFNYPPINSVRFVSV